MTPLRPPKRPRLKLVIDLKKEWFHIWFNSLLKSEYIEKYSFLLYHDTVFSFLAINKLLFCVTHGQSYCYGFALPQGPYIEAPGRTELSEKRYFKFSIVYIYRVDVPRYTVFCFITAPKWICFFEFNYSLFYVTLLASYPND